MTYRFSKVKWNGIIETWYRSAENFTAHVTKKFNSLTSLSILYGCLCAIANGNDDSGSVSFELPNLFKITTSTTEPVDFTILAIGK